MPSPGGNTTRPDRRRRQARSSSAAGAGQLGRPGGRLAACGRSSLTPGRAGWSRGHGSGVPPSAQRHPPGEGAAAPSRHHLHRGRLILGLLHGNAGRAGPVGGAAGSPRRRRSWGPAVPLPGGSPARRARPGVPGRSHGHGRAGRAAPRGGRSGGRSDGLPCRLPTVAEPTHAKLARPRRCPEASATMTRGGAGLVGEVVRRR